MRATDGPCDTGRRSGGGRGVVGTWTPAARPPLPGQGARGLRSESLAIIDIDGSCRKTMQGFSPSKINKFGGYSAR